MASVGVYAAINLLKSSIHSFYSHGSIQVAKERMKSSDAQPAAAPAVDGAKSITGSLNQSRNEGFLYQEARTITEYRILLLGASEQEASRPHPEDKRVWSLSRKQMSKTHARTHIHTIRNNNRRKKKNCTDFFKVPSVSLSLGERTGACECVRDGICMSVALKVCSPSQLFLGRRSGFDWLPLGKPSTAHLSFLSKPRVEGRNFFWETSVRLQRLPFRKNPDCG